VTAAIPISFTVCNRYFVFTVLFANNGPSLSVNDIAKVDVSGYFTVSDIALFFIAAGYFTGISGCGVRRCCRSCPNPLTPHYCYKGIVKHSLTDRVKPSFVIFDIRALWRSALSVTVPENQKLQMTT